MKYLLIVLTLLIPAASLAASPDSSLPTRSALIAAARQAKVEAIDYGWQHCDRDTTIDAWLKSLVGPYARAITWHGGECQLVNKMPNPGIDASSWPWCARAEITLVHPRDRHDIPIVEIFLEQPNHGRPGAAYAIRTLMMTRDGGGDHLRFRQDFEAEWRDRFPPDPDATTCSDD